MRQRKFCQRVCISAKRLRRLMRECHWQSLRDATADAFLRWRAEQTQAPKTINEYHAVLSALFTWLRKQNRVAANPFEIISKVDTRGKQRSQRRANFPTRISFQVTSKIDSRTILSEMGAEQLLGQGDMLYMAGGGRISRVHGPFVSDGEVEHIVAYLRTQGQPQYLDAITSEEDAAEAAAGEPLASPGSMDAEKLGDLYDRAVAIVLRDKKCSTSYIQRRLSVGYNKAASLVEQMEREGVVSPANHSGKREILVGGGVDRGAFDIEAAE